MPLVEIDRAHRIFDDMRAQSADPPGVTRASYGEGENYAHQLVADWAQDIGLDVQHDYAGNQYMTLKGNDQAAPRLMMGSHMDSVRHGGNFDGAAGVICGMAALHRLSRTGYRPSCNLTVMAVRAEEMVWFPCHYAGSRMAFGLLEPDVYDSVKRSDSQRSLADHMRDLGFDPDALKAGNAYLDAKDIRAFIEVHIEQGPVLLSEGKPLGVVSGIRGNLRYRTCHVVGSYSHAGGIPQDLRQDAVFAFVEFAHELEAYCSALKAAGTDIVFTIGEAYTDAANHAITKVPGRFDFKMDIRSIDNGVLLQFDADMRDVAAKIATRRRVAFDIGSYSNAVPALMDAGLRDGLHRQISALSIPTMDISSGGGHDCAVFAGQGVRSAMLFIRNDGGSHNPDESMDMADFEHAVDVLSNMLIHEC